MPIKIDISPSYARRSLTLPHGGLGPPGPPLPASLSPNHVFLQSHLPPTFPHSATTPETEHPDPTSHPMVILTPTTQGWRELREISRLEGEEVSSEEESEGSEREDGRRSSSASDGGPGSRSSSLLLRVDSVESPTSAPMKKPLLRESHSADYLGRELSHTPDPGSPTSPIEQAGESPDRPVFQPVIIAPSPVMPGDDQVPEPPETPTRGGGKQAPTVFVEEQRDDSPDRSEEGSFGFGVKDLDREKHLALEEESPVRYASIGRRESLHILTKPDVRAGVPRTKTKRELERERLFKDLDENIQTEGIELKDAWSSGVQEIGSGAGLGSRPSTADAVLEGRTGNVSNRNLAKTASLPATSKPLLSPTHKFKPSPLHASPLTVTNGLPTPDSPSVDSPSSPEAPRRISSSGHTTNLGSLRDFARSLVSPHPPHVKSRPSTPSPPKSPRSPRRRDSQRVSLVAGRIVQPFAIPPSTSLPPDRLLPEKPSLQSFSPFQTPSSSAFKLTGSPILPPIFSRLDSTISLAPSIGAPSECGTPTSETTGGIGGRGIDDYVILKEAGKGAYGLVMRAKVKGPKGEPVGVSNGRSRWNVTDVSRMR